MRRGRADGFRWWLAAAMLLVSAARAHALVLPASSYDRHYFSEPGSHESIQSSGELSGKRWGIAGWVEYQVDVATTGWYGLWTHGAPPSGVEFIVDPGVDGSAPAERYFHQREYPHASRTPVGNVWLTAGRHRLRLARFFWTGFPGIAAIELRQASGGLEEAVHVFFKADQLVFRKGECPELVAYGGTSAQGSLEIVDASADGSRQYGRYSVLFATSGAPVAHSVRLACTEAGFHRLSWRLTGRSAPGNPTTLAFQVIDTGTPPPSVAMTTRPPLVDIDCATQVPDYSSADGTRIRSLANARYRESGATGWIFYQRLAAAERGRHPEPSWFAYTLRGVLPQQRYRIEVDYPDDASRTFAVAWREPAPLHYPVASAVETGREYRLSSEPQTLVFHAWARASSPRLTFLPAHDGTRAACLRIRVYLDGSFTTPPVRSTGKRQFLNWYEEGENFTSFFGPATDDAQGFNVAVERWLRHAADSGVDTLLPTVSVYNFAMYPSRFNQSFSEPRRDTLRVLLLQAERFGMKLIPELHPRADELAYAGNGARTLANLAVSREGKDNFTGPSGRNVPPYFNALDPGNQQWYIGMVRELAERYRDSPALQGISLRYMTWANPALDNLVSLDWGYDDTTIALYRAHTGSKLPAGAPGDTARFQKRHDWLLANEKAAWVQWRCVQLTQLFTRIRDAVRAARPDLMVYLHLFGPAASTAEGFRTPLREAGLDLEALAKIDGLMVVNSTFTYGRLEPDGIFFNATRDPLLDPAVMGAAPDRPGQQWVLPTSVYLEAIGDLIVPPGKLGFAASTKPAWMSVASNPPGRQALERFALLLAQTDSLVLGDGGNNYTLGPPVVAEFAREFRKLPAVPFEQIAGAVDPITVRTHASGAELVFYAVNRENYPVQVRITLSSGEAREFELRAYELRVMTAAPAVRILGVTATIPQAERSRIAARIQWVRALLADPAGGLKVAGWEAVALTQAASTAQRALDGGLAWRARVAFETSAALRAFRSIGCFPPDMRAQFPTESTCGRD
jgi:hypothetical protein